MEHSVIGIEISINSLFVQFIDIRVLYVVAPNLESEVSSDVGKEN
jgi:hypothetical protein